MHPIHKYCNPADDPLLGSFSWLKSSLELDGWWGVRYLAVLDGYFVWIAR
jgi:hypothetical protein